MYYKLVDHTDYNSFKWDDTTKPFEIKTVTIRMSDREIINFLEKKNELMEKTLKIVKEYAPEEYINASIELENYLNENRVSIK